MKMYILVRSDVPLGYAINGVAHASLACFLKYASHRDMQRWLADSFKKVTCRVSDEELAEAMKEDSDHVVITESVLGHETLCVAFSPRKEWPEIFETFDLYK
jgi:peptidyl-tRNA hydrolase